MASDGFIREVDEELQRERMSRLWKRYGPMIVGVALLVVAAVAGKVGWDAWQSRQLEQQGAAFAAAEAAMMRGETDNAAAQFSDLAANQGGNAASLARLREAEARLALGDSEAALALLDQVVATERIDPLLRDYAAVTAAQQRLGSIDPNTLRTSLEPLAASDRPFRHTAQELLALAALEAGDEGVAVATLRRLQLDLATPDDMRRRTEELLSSLGIAEDEGPPLSPSTEEAS